MAVFSVKFGAEEKSGRVLWGLGYGKMYTREMIPQVMPDSVTGTGTCLDVANPGLLQNDMTDRIFMEEGGELHVTDRDM